MTRRPLAVTIGAIAGLVIIEVVALLTHTDGQILSLVIAALAGLGGYTLSRVIRA